MKYCLTCYRKLEEDRFKQKSDHCWTCMAIIGKGAGYGSTISEEEADKWLEGLQERKKAYETDINK